MCMCVFETKWRRNFQEWPLLNVGRTFSSTAQQLNGFFTGPSYNFRDTVIQKFVLQITHRQMKHTVSTSKHKQASLASKQAHMSMQLLTTATVYSLKKRARASIHIYSVYKILKSYHNTNIHRSPYAYAYTRNTRTHKTIHTYARAYSHICMVWIYTCTRVYDAVWILYAVTVCAYTSFFIRLVCEWCELN